MVKDDDSPDAHADPARQRERRYLVVLAVVSTLIAVVAGAVAGGLTVSSVGDAEQRDTEGIWLILGVTIGVIVVLDVLVIWFVLWRRRHGSAIFARSPLWELPRRRDRSALVRVLRRGDPIEPEQRDLALRVARDSIARRGLVWLYLGIGVIQGANGLLQDEGWLRWIQITTGLLFLYLACYTAWLINRMRRAASTLQYDTVE